MPPKERAASAAALKEEKAAQKAAQDAEAHEASIWAIGGKDNSKLKAMEDKEEEKRRKAAEKAALLAAEEADLSGVKREVKTKVQIHSPIHSTTLVLSTLNSFAMNLMYAISSTRKKAKMLLICWMLHWQKCPKPKHKKKQKKKRNWRMNKKQKKKRNVQKKKLV